MGRRVRIPTDQCSMLVVSTVKSSLTFCSSFSPSYCNEQGHYRAQPTRRSRQEARCQPAQLSLFFQLLKMRGLSPPCVYHPASSWNTVYSRAYFWLSFRRVSMISISSHARTDAALRAFRALGHIERITVGLLAAIAIGQKRLGRTAWRNKSLTA